jgi:hypothetical protein
MPHGDFSDYAGFFCLATGFASIFAPQLWMKELGPMKPMFDGPLTSETTAVISFAGNLLLFMGFCSFIVRWNTMNGAAAFMGYFFAAINAAYIPYKMDGGFVFRVWHVFSIMFFFSALHMKFNANPMWTSETLKAKEEEKAKKAKEKAKKN